MSIYALRPNASKRSSIHWGNGLQLALLIINVQVLAWVILRTNRAPETPHDVQRATARGTLTGHSELHGFSLPSSSPKVDNLDNLDLPVEIWARPPIDNNSAQAQAVKAVLSSEELEELRAMCGRTLYHGLENIVVSHGTGLWTFFATGDLPLMWIRDSAFQIGVLLPRISRRPSLRRVIEGAIRAQAFYILQDPYANGFYPDWRHPQEHNTGDRQLGRGGWVGVRNYELDSGCYYLNLLWNYYRTPGLYRPEVLISETMIFDAAMTMIRLWVSEQHHNETSPYRFSELPNGGLGSAVGYTGMTWSGFRPSDDANTYGYSIPSNTYAAGALRRALYLNKAVWHSDDFHTAASHLLKDIEHGLHTYGMIDLNGGQKVYAYEVDGLGHTLTDFDDPNWPSLVSMPLLGYSDYDKSVYRTTRSRLLSSANRYWFEGQHFKGMGSPHTSHGMAWALGTLSEALTSETPADQAEKLRLLLKLQCGDGLMHESIDVNSPTRCTRRWFEWANALSVTAIEQLLGIDCDASAEALYRKRVAEREMSEGKGGGYNAQHHQALEAAVQWDVKYVERVEAWKGIGHLI